MTKRVCVIGAGISGLCVAYFLRTAGVDVILFERESTVGGNIQTKIRDGFLIERGPNSTLASRELLDLINSLGLSDQIATPNSNAKKRFILRDGRLIALPSKIVGLVRNKAFSVKSKLRLLKEPIVRTKSPANESVAEFFERRLGREIVDYAVDPFISGIYAGNPEKLSIRHAFPKLHAMEKKYRSILIGSVMSRTPPEARLPPNTPRSITFANGMQTLTDSLSQRLVGNIRTATTVIGIQAIKNNQFQIETVSGQEIFDFVIICTPASAAARLVESLDNNLSQNLESVYYPPLAVVITAFKKDDVLINPDGFGFLVPGVEKRKILGSLWTSSVFENRAPSGYHLFTTFIGGARKAELPFSSEEELISIVRDELGAILKIDGEPVFVDIKRWEKAIPQYNIGYEKVVAAIETFEKAHPGIIFCSNFYKGISVTDCVKNSVAAADGILKQISPVE